MIDAGNALSVRTQCEFVQVQRSGYYYQSKRQCGVDGKLLNEIHEIWLAGPYYGNVINLRNISVNHLKKWL